MAVLEIYIVHYSETKLIAGWSTVNLHKVKVEIAIFFFLSKLFVE